MSNGIFFKSYECSSTAMMPEADSRRLEANLERLGAILPCSRCGGVDFQTVGYFNMSPTDHPGTIQMGGNSIPFVAVACLKCGHFSFHALNAINR